MITSTSRRRGMSPLQTVLLLGVAFVVVWGLQEIWRQLKPLVQVHVHRILGVDASADSGHDPAGGTGRVGGGGGPPVGGGGPGSASPPKPEPKNKLFETPKGPMTDDEIGNAQWWDDFWWGASGFLLPGGIGSQALYTSAFGEVMERSVGFAMNEGGTAGETNALQHAYWQAQLAYWYGEEQARAIGDKHETLQMYGNALRRRDSVADLHNNRVGRGIGLLVKEEAAVAGPGFDPNQRMMQLIVQAIQSGLLDLGGGVGGVGVGPGPGRDGLRKRGIEPRPYSSRN